MKSLVVPTLLAVLTQEEKIVERHVLLKRSKSLLRVLGELTILFYYIKQFVKLDIDSIFLQ